MHVMMAVAQMGAGGAEQIVATLARDLLATDETVTIATSGGWLSAPLAAAGARLVFAPLEGRRPRDLARAAIAVRGELGSSHVDVIHAHNVKAAGVCTTSSLGRRRPPLVVTLHGVADDRYRSAARILSRGIDVVVAVSDDVARRVTAAGFPAARLRVIENAVVQRQPHAVGAARARLGLPSDAPIVLCIARLAAQKRHDLLIDAWRAMPPNALLLIAGDGETRPAVEAAIRDSGRAETIRLLGERGDVDWLLAAADVCVLPTDWEGLPISVLEAMAARVPVVASAVDGLSQFGAEAIELVSPGSALALANGLRRVLDDGRRREGMVSAGTALVAARFSVGRMVSEYRELYELLRLTGASGHWIARCRREVRLGGCDHD
jgi:glycosyltransferase involved in cell wall biosynthesis